MAPPALEFKEKLILLFSFIFLLFSHSIYDVFKATHPHTFLD